MINDLPVPPGASRKKRPPAFVSMLAMVFLYALIYSSINLGSLLSMKLVSSVQWCCDIFLSLLPMSGYIQ